MSEVAGLRVDGALYCLSCSERAFGWHGAAGEPHPGDELLLSEMEGETHCSRCGHCFDHPEDECTASRNNITASW